jgi:hypothetical protein
MTVAFEVWLNWSLKKMIRKMVVCETFIRHLEVKPKGNVIGRR